MLSRSDSHLHPTIHKVSSAAQVTSLTLQEKIPHGSRHWEDPTGGGKLQPPASLNPQHELLLCSNYLSFLHGGEDYLIRSESK